MVVIIPFRRYKNPAFAGHSRRICFYTKKITKNLRLFMAKVLHFFPIGV